MKSVTMKIARARRSVFALGAILGVLLFSVSLFSQGNNGRILGTVTDQTGGVISGATVTFPIANSRRIHKMFLDITKSFS